MKAINTKKLRSHLGSFWYENVDEESQAKLQKVIDSAVSSNAHSVLTRAVNRLRDTEGTVAIENELLVPTWRDVDLDGELWYGVGVAVDFLPPRVRYKDVVYVLGIDYIVLGVGHEMVFRDKLDASHLVVDGLKPNAGNILYSVLYGLYMSAPAGNAKYIANYLRGNHQPGAFLDALFAQAGFKHVYKGGEVLSKNTHASHLVYEFADEIVEVPYKHTELTAGTKVEAGSWIGAEGITLSIHDANNPTWYRDNNDWSTNGLDLSRLVSVNGLLAEDNNVTVTDVSGTMEFPFSEAAVGANAKFWARVSEREPDHGDGTGLSQLLNNGDTVNPIDFVFTYLLDHALIIKLDSRVIKPRAIMAMNSWVKRNVPFGYATIVRVVDDAGQELSIYDYVNNFNQLDDEALYPIDFEPMTGFVTFGDIPITFGDVQVTTALYTYVPPASFSDLVFVVYNTESLGYGDSKLIYK